MVVVEVAAAEVFVVEVAAGVEERTVVASVVVLTVVSVVAVFVAVVLTLPTLKKKSLEPGKQDHQILNIISSSFVYSAPYLFIALW
jgi:ATP-dependent phosphoenolpyruvate carboxykinase